MRLGIHMPSNFLLDFHHSCFVVDFHFFRVSLTET
jgi:hypothetical protein